jgi:hypothetical protein
MNHDSLRVSGRYDVMMSGDRVRHGQPRGAQLAQQPPLAKRACALLPEPNVVVVDEARNEPAAPIVTQHPRFVAMRDDQHFAAPRGLDRDGACAPPLVRIEPGGKRRLGAIVGGEHEMAPVGHELLVRSHH